MALTSAVDTLACEQVQAAPIPELAPIDIVAAVRGKAHYDFALAECVRVCAQSGDLDAIHAYERVLLFAQLATKEARRA